MVYLNLKYISIDFLKLILIIIQVIIQISFNYIITALIRKCLYPDH
jgi:hypothetical protein